MPISGLLVLQRHQGRALDDRDVVAREVVLRQELAHLELDELEKLRVVDHVDLVHEHDERRHADLAGEQDVLAGLRHGAVGGGDDEDRAVHLRRAGDHVLHVVGVAGAVDVGVVALVGLVLDVGGRDRDAARLLLRRLVDLVVGGEGGAARLGQDLGDRRRQRRLAVVDVADRADVAVGLVALEFRLGHGGTPSFRLSLIRMAGRPGPARDPVAGFSGVLRDDLLGLAARHFLVVVELHGERRPALGHGPQRVHVAEHVGERHDRVDDVGVAAHVLTLDLPAPGVQVADDAARVLLGRHHLDLHHRLQQHRLALLQRVAKRRAGRDLEGERRRVDLVVGAVDELDLEVDHREPGEHAGPEHAIRGPSRRRG